MADAAAALRETLERGIPVGQLEEAAHAAEQRRLVALPPGHVTPTDADLEQHFALLQLLLRLSPAKTPLSSSMTQAFLALDEGWGGKLSKARGPKRLAWASLQSDAVRAMLMRVFQLVRPFGRVGSGARRGRSKGSGRAEGMGSAPW
jgi:hypothetical protein